MVNKLIHQMIFGDIPSAEISACLKSWKVLSVFQFKIAIWDRASALKFIKENYPFATQAFAEARNLSEASDIARYLVVHHYGGYYVDWDISLNNVGQFLELHRKYPNGCLIIDPSNDTIASEFYSALPREEFLLTLTRSIVDTYDRGERELFATQYYAGPFKITEAFNRNPITRQRLVRVKDVFEYDYAESRLATEFGKSGIMTHYWSHSWL